MLLVLRSNTILRLNKQVIEVYFNHSIWSPVADFTNKKIPWLSNPTYYFITHPCPKFNSVLTKLQWESEHRGVLEPLVYVAAISHTYNGLNAYLAKVKESNMHLVPYYLSAKNLGANYR